MIEPTLRLILTELANDRRAGMYVGESRDPEIMRVFISGYQIGSRGEGWEIIRRMEDIASKRYGDIRVCGWADKIKLHCRKPEDRYRHFQEIVRAALEEEDK